MERMRYLGLVLVGLIIVMQLIGFVYAQEINDGDIHVFGLELEKILAMVNAWIALFLFVVAFIAYRRDGRTRLFFVSLAFLLFSIKSFLMSSELFFPEIEWLAPVSIVLEFLVLLSFFYGVLKK
jgi:purine-cytosine permease-like protein